MWCGWQAAGGWAHVICVTHTLRMMANPKANFLITQQASRHPVVTDWMSPEQVEPSIPFSLRDCRLGLLGHRVLSMGGAMALVARPAGRRVVLVVVSALAAVYCWFCLPLARPAAR